MRKYKSTIVTVTMAALIIGLFTLTTAMGKVAMQPTTKSPILTITIMDKGISYMPKMPMGGDYTVKIVNKSKAMRGLTMTGMDRGGSPYVRYGAILRPGKSESFKWYFPSQQAVYFQELLSCKHAERSCVIATFGRLKAAIKFQ